MTLLECDTTANDQDIKLAEGSDCWPLYGNKSTRSQMEKYIQTPYTSNAITTIRQTLETHQGCLPQASDHTRPVSQSPATPGENE